MKKLLTSIAAAVFLLFPINGFAAYVIHLKDGTKFVTDQYYEEGDQIKFKRYGGLVGIEKDRIREIEETADPTEPADKKETPAETAAPPAAAEADKQQATNDKAYSEKAKQGASGSKENKEDTKQGVEKNRQRQAWAEKEKNLIGKYVKEFDLIKAKFKNVEMMTKEDLLKFSRELDTFKKAVLSNRVGGFFSKQLVEIYSMLDRIEAILKFKGD
jgi:hypothetical protein